MTTFYHSTRSADDSVTSKQAILTGIAPDGGLYVSDGLGEKTLDLATVCAQGFHDTARLVLGTLLPDYTADELASCVDAAYGAQWDAEAVCPVTPLGTDWLLELYHGPTCAFKDVALQMLPQLMSVARAGDGRKIMIVTATSGDTGGAVASAFHGRSHISVKVLFPKGRVAERQRRQLTGWDGNVSSYEVEGSFDDCQRMVKEAFMDPSLHGLSSANSINLGRLLPQMAYYVYASAVYKLRYGVDPVIVVPTGNAGNATGAYWAKAMGAPISRIVLAANANKPITDYLETGKYEPRPSVQTLANAMDVGAPSNIERLFRMFPDAASFRENVSAWSVSDEDIRRTIKEVYDESGYVICPHTACGERVRRDHLSGEPSIVVSTAHPAKFSDTVEPLIGREVAIPENLYRIMHSTPRAKEIPADYHQLW